MRFATAIRKRVLRSRRIDAHSVTTPTDEMLMVKAQQGDQAAFAQLVHRHVDALYSYALRLCKSHTSAEDLVQESWLSAWTNAASFDARKAKLTTWLHRIVVNKFIDGTRRKTEVLDEVAVGSAVADGNLSQDLALEQRLATLDSMINALPEEQRAALVLRHIQGFSNDDVSHILGVSVHAVESLLARARRSLRNQDKLMQESASQTKQMQDGNDHHE